MIVSLLAATALAATAPLTVRQDCDATGDIAAKLPPMVVVAFPSSPAGEKLFLGTLGSTTAKSRFSIRIEDRLAEIRTFAFVAYDRAGTALGKAIVDVDVATGEVTGLAGDGLSVGRFATSRTDADLFDVQVVLEDDVALGAALVTLTDITGDGATVEGDAFEQAVALRELDEKGRGILGSYTFDDAHGIDSARQTWEGTLAVDTALDGAALAFSADAERCLPADVEAPADGTLEWTETLNLRGTAKKPKWKSISLGLNEAETETWVWPFRARVEDATAEGVIVSLQASEGAVGPRASEITVKVPARERLSGSGSFASWGAGTETLLVNVHPFGVPSRPLATFQLVRTLDQVTVATSSYLELNNEKDGIVLYDQTKSTWLFADGAGPAVSGGSARFDGDGYVLSTVTLSGPEQAEWDGTVTVAVGGDAVWADLEVTSSLVSGGAESQITFPLTTLRSVFEGAFLFDADPSGGTYRWDCIGCGDGFDPFAVQAQFGIGTRSTASQANNKAELL